MNTISTIIAVLRVGFTRQRYPGNGAFIRFTCNKVLTFVDGSDITQNLNSVEKGVFDLKIRYVNFRA